MKIEKLQLKGQSLIIFTVSIIVITILSVLLFQLVLTPRSIDEKKDQVISNQIIIERIEEKFFAVTRTVYTDHEVKIKIKRDSGFNEFLWGKEIKAQGRVRTDLGIDLNNLALEDIEIDKDNKKIIIKDRKAEILNSSINDKLKVYTEGTLLTKIFDNTNNEDYKKASDQLINSAEEVIYKDDELLLEAKNAASEFLSYLFTDFGYEVVVL